MTTTESPATTIQRAATRLREHAAKAHRATPAPWTVDDADHVVRSADGMIVADRSCEDHPAQWADLPYIAAMHPGVATKLADWLAWEADLAARAPVTEFQARTAHALAVARQILAEA